MLIKTTSARNSYATNRHRFPLPAAEPRSAPLRLPALGVVIPAFAISAPLAFAA